MLAQLENREPEATLARYLNNLDSDCFDTGQVEWFKRMKEAVEIGEGIYSNSVEGIRQSYIKYFGDWVRTEELKAWYGTREGNSLFQGTSISSLTIPSVTPYPLAFDSIDRLEEEIADSYIRLHDQYERDVRNAIIEDVSDWMEEGLFYGVVIASKVISQAFHLAVPQDSIIFPVDGVEVDPHEITSYPMEIRQKYFETCREMITCYADLKLSLREFEESLVLADISKPRILAYKDKLMLAPVKCNEICSLLSQNITRRIREKTGGRISPRSLMVTIYDTDTPYTYHQIAGYYNSPLAPILPGITLLGVSGTIDAFRWLYAYRVSLIAQKLMKSSLCSEVSRKFIPFIFFGVLVKRDADILLDMDQLGILRYRGNISPYIEYCYLLPKIKNAIERTSTRDLSLELTNRIM